MLDTKKTKYSHTDLKEECLQDNIFKANVLASDIKVIKSARASNVHV